MIQKYNETPGRGGGGTRDGDVASLNNTGLQDSSYRVGARVDSNNNR